MAMDGGVAGLDQSDHHPLAGRSQYPPPLQTPASEPPTSSQGGTGDPASTIIHSIIACVIPGKTDEVTRLLQELREADASTATTTTAATSLRTSRTSVSDNDPVTIGQLKAILQETLLKPPPVNPQRPSYASVARQPTTGPTGNVQIIPERRTRELLIRNGNPPEDLARRSAVEVVAAVNTAIGTNDAVATRRLPSGDVILTFQDVIPKTALQDRTWVQRAFGERALLHESEFAVIVKGLPVSRTARVDPGQLLKNIQQRITEATRLKIETPRVPTARFTTAILHLRSVEAATRLCEQGLVWEAQIFNCEPYSADLRLRRCFGCHQFGHYSRFCKNKPRCGHCAGAAHPQGETGCPQLHSVKKCVNCGGPHPAWDRNCPKALEAKELAQEAYQHRPRQFEVSGSNTRRTRRTTPAPSQDSDDGFQVVRSKRQRTDLPSQRSQSRASEAPARRGRPPLGALDKVTIQSRDITQMFSQGTDPFALSQETQIPGTPL
jgi:hypothetical protein